MGGSQDNKLYRNVLTHISSQSTVPTCCFIWRYYMGTINKTTSNTLKLTIKNALITKNNITYHW